MIVKNDMIEKNSRRETKLYFAILFTHWFCQFRDSDRTSSISSSFLGFIAVVEENPVLLGYLEGNGNHTQWSSTDFRMFHES